MKDNIENMNLDKEHYKDTKSAKNLNTTKILVNKHYSLDKNYTPDNLEEISNRYALEGMEMVKEAADAFENMAKNLVELKVLEKSEDAALEFAQYSVCDIEVARKVIELL